jgi:hypothetical protein
VLVLTGEDPQALQAAAMAVEKDLRTDPRPRQIVPAPSLVRPEIAVRPDFARAADLGVTSRPSARRCASPRRATTTGAAEAEPVAAPGADRVKLAGRVRARTWACWSA